LNWRRLFQKFFRNP